MKKKKKANKKVVKAAETKPKSPQGFEIVEEEGIAYIDVRRPENRSMKTDLWNRLTGSLEVDEVDDFNSKYPVSYLVQHAHLLGPLMSGPLGDVLRERKDLLQQVLKSRMVHGEFEMTDIPMVMPIGSEIIVEADPPVAGILQNLQVQRTWLGRHFTLRLAVIHSPMGIPVEGVWEVEVSGYRGLKPLSKLPFRILTSAEKQALTERGRKFLQFHKPGSYAMYTGIMDQPSFWSSRSFKAAGRVIIDPVSLSRVESDLAEDITRVSRVSHDSSFSRRLKVEKEEAAIPDGSEWRCWPYLAGFSMSAKKWGRILVDELSPVEFREKAFGSLVLDAGIKTMVHSLVKHHEGTFTDIIEGKGGGCIFLLHGEPGWGKTATAEAVAEQLHRPLYSVSVGELGTDTEALESRLRQILDVAMIWNAVILLDEADIFLEARDSRDVHRNAMVGVFLRLLEYHNGVLFLTTNRVKDIDKAFYSRISVAVHYKAQKGRMRAEIWKNLLTAAGLDTKYADALSVHEANGRQIKNAIRIGQTLAKAKGRDLALEDLEDAVKASLQFAQEMELPSSGSKSLPSGFADVRKTNGHPVLD